MTDWDEGDYARTAAELAPAAEVVLDAARVGPGDRVLDVGCGTGNALVVAARRGATPLGVDPAPGLVAQARSRLRAEGLPGTAEVGTALALPDDDEAFDAVVSVFGVIFAPDPPRDLAAMVRALRPGGRLAVSAWMPAGPLAAVLGGLRRLAGTPPAGRAPTWHDPDAARHVLLDAGAREPEVGDHALVFRAPSPEAWLTAQDHHHPAWIGVRRQATPAAWDAFHAEALAVLRAANEDPAGFAVTSRYVVITAAR